MYCYICKERDKASTYHIFPKDPEIRVKWLVTFGFEEDDVFKSTRVCGKHFTESCFYISNIRGEKKLLRKGSIPELLLSKEKTKSAKRKLDEMFDPSSETFSIISFEPASSLLCSRLAVGDVSVNSESRQEEATVEINDIHIESDAEVECVAQNTSTVSSKSTKQKRWRPAYVSQIDIVHGFDTPRRARRNFDMAAKEISALKQKIVHLNRKNCGLTKKVEHLQSLLKFLKEKIDF